MPTTAAESPAANQTQSLRELAARLIESDGQGGWRTNEKAATELEKLGTEATSSLLPLLKDQAVEVRRGAAFHLLGQFDPADAAQVAAFSALLDDSDRTIRGIGLSAVSQMNPADQIAAVPRLAAMLNSTREAKAENRMSIARLFGGLKSHAIEGLGVLVSAAASDPDARVRAACVVAVSQVAAPAQAVGPLTKGLSDPEAAVRIVATARLRQLGSAAAPAAGELATRLSDDEPKVRDAAAEALILIGSPAVEPLSAQLESSSVDARKYALACLARIGPQAKSAQAKVEKCLQDADPDVRKLAEAALRQMGAR
jgi:HEAT repeat protein